MGFREVQVTDDAVRAGRNIGLCGDIAKRIARMARRAAPITHDQGNWRYEEFVLDIEDGKVLAVSRLLPEAVGQVE